MRIAHLERPDVGEEEGVASEDSFARLEDIHLLVTSYCTSIASIDPPPCLYHGLRSMLKVDALLGLEVQAH